MKHPPRQNGSIGRGLPSVPVRTLDSYFSRKTSETQGKGEGGAGVGEEEKKQTGTLHLRVFQGGEGETRRGNTYRHSLA